MLLGCIADDFTGASDLANTLAKGGMRTVQFSGVPESGEGPDCEAAVVALKTRSIAADEAVAASLAAADWLAGQGCRQFLFKYCSTFDSTPKGNIGPVAAALIDRLGADAAIVCPVFPATGRTLYMGHLFVGDRLLSESGMEHHPLNPMTDADIRRWLQRQTPLPVGHVGYGAVRGGAGEIAARFRAEAEAGKRLIVVDAVTDADLLAIGEAAADHRLVTGGSGIALGLPENFRRRGLLRDAGSDYTPVKGPAIALCGSCSRASNEQVAAYLKSHPGFVVSAEAVLSGETTVRSALDFLGAHAEAEPIFYSTAEPAAVKAVQERFGRERVASAIEGFFSELCAGAVAAGVRRIAVGGGETSGAVVTALKLAALQVGPEIAPGVPALAADDPVPLRLALKSGNFGDAQFFEKALAVLGAAR
ncbi:3-oxo-tetronate kinase [Jiella sp. M17.18]|uniref:3-oxo-tetronate kinase n=1 Tax=Jiella sp. M17.18 TaxID=3234247 RepID=UPI0034E03152